MLRILLFINDNVRDLTGPPPWNHGRVVSKRQQLINAFSAEPGRNGQVYADWVTAGSNEEWRWYTTDWHGHPEPLQKTYPGGLIQTATVESIIEDTDYIVSSLWEPALRDGAGDWAMSALLTSREYPIERLEDYPLYGGPDDWL